MAPAPRGSASGQKFPCSQCDKVFSRKEYMARHYRSKHSKEKPFACEYCSHGFSRSDLLRRHYKTCSEAKALGVTGPPPGSERPRASTSSRATKTSRTRSQSETSPDPSLSASSSSGESPTTQHRFNNDEDGGDELMLPVPPDLPVASTSTSTSAPTLMAGTHARYENDSRDVAPHRQDDSNGGMQTAYYPPPPPHPYAHYTAPSPYHNPYSQSPYYHPYPLQPPSSVPGPSPSDLAIETPVSISPHAAATSLSEYLRQNHEALQHQMQPSSLPLELRSQHSHSQSPTTTTDLEILHHHQPPPPQAQATSPQQPPPPPPLPRPDDGRSSSSPGPPRPLASSSSATTTMTTSAFRPGTAKTDTLAPGLSGTGSFSADEVLASEVLRDLMKSPMSSSVNRPGMSRGDSGDSATGGGRRGGGGGQRGIVDGDVGGGGSSSRSDQLAIGDDYDQRRTRGHDAKGQARGQEALTRHNHEQEHGQKAVVPGNHASDWGLIGGGIDGFGSSKANTPIEESPAAIALSSYFNAGGVRGISALDLGFPIEPSLFSDWILNPTQTPFQDESDRRFEFSEANFNIAYLYPWHVPPLKTLSQYAKKATEMLLPSVPVFHAPSVQINKMALHSAFALTIAGGAYETDGQSFSNEMLVEKRVFLIRGFLDPAKTWHDRFASLQSLLLYQLLGFFHRDEQQRLLAQQFHTSLIYMFKQLDVPKKVRETPVPWPSDDAAPEIVEQCWKDWVKVETWKRVSFIVFLTDLEHSIATGAPQFVQLSDMDLDLPGSEFAWAAETATEWQVRSRRSRSDPAMSFLAAVRALLAQNPEPFSEHSITLAELSRLSSFPLLILARMLSYMEKKCEEALQQVDPFKPLLGGLGMATSREQENRTMLARIRNGREILRGLPGGLARGGGEKWFRDTMPTAFGGAPRRESSMSSSTSTKSTKTSSPSDESLNTPPQDTYEALLSEIELEDAYGHDPNAYRPYHSEGGAWPGETYEDAQERLRKHREANAPLVAKLIPQFPY